MFHFDVASFFLGAGVVVILYFFYHILNSLYNIIFPYLLLRPVDLHKKAGAPWAVVTGATDGIGKAFAFELASKGFSIILVSRTQLKLDNTRRELLETFSNIEVDTITFDFSTGCGSDYKALVDYLQNKQIGILVNNVGGISDYPDILHRSIDDATKLGTEVNINTLPATILCAAVLPQFASRRGGIIVNVSSAASSWKFIGWAIYCASKKYVSWLTSILQREYEPYGITIHCLMPMLVTTKLSKIDKPSFFGPDTKTYVRQAVRTIGLIKETTGYITHQFQYEGSKYVPQYVLDYVIARKNEELRALSRQKWAK